MTTQSSADMQRHLRRAFGNFPTGVTVITAQTPLDERDVGLTVNSFSSVSMSPPMLLWSISSRSPSLPAFAVGRRHLVHVLTREQAPLATHFATAQTNKFAHLGLQRDGLTSALRLNDYCALFSCETLSISPAGDHQIVLCGILDFEQRKDSPLVFAQGRFSALPELANSEG